jgi:hypothetical protein
LFVIVVGLFTYTLLPATEPGLPAVDPPVPLPDPPEAPPAPPVPPAPRIDPLLTIVIVSVGLNELGTSIAYAGIVELPTVTPGLICTVISVVPAM